MPTKTFENLKPDKREIILNALLNEFSHYKLPDAQVARIIKDCGIARGSFYKYFADLTDSYHYTLKRVLDKVHFDVFSRIRENHQNTLTSFNAATTDFIKRISQSKYLDFYRLYVEYNQYEIKRPVVDYHHFNPEQLPLWVNGQLLSNSNVAAVIYKAATAASHNTIRAILMGADRKTELADLKTMLQIMNQGLLEEVH
ncbi:TetR/AcrR family transcriptional regulator [Nicoliella spurrieriana]|uniref:TetR/AcrR family transcriptional regulator n=1 Tax=Nicoliella spurrieriana TaxID=2925830 RepID=A0A976X5V9_9LACO|nr:TetR/AcrR family transcriptional regulator [Nicoliella spurrieriana]UQS87119.1 TetR/AcrR family transcriptional regulator [Nicoliella spurrieriana]